MPASIKHLTDKKLNLTSLLARWKDGLYYKAAVVKCDKAHKRCLVCFEDGSEIWANNRDVHIQLTLDQLNEDEDIVCCVCDDGSSEAPNEIILCDVCQQGYHQKCHNPPVDSSKIDESEETSDHKDWFCATCSYILNQSNRAKLSATAQQQSKQQQHQIQPKPEAQQQAQPQSKPKTQSPSQATPILPAQQTQKQPVKVKQTPIIQQQQPSKTTNIGPVKPIVNHVQKPAPYYPLSSQVRAGATSSTAALASMTASSALVVGSSAGRTKQDLVNQSNRSSQRQLKSSGEAVMPPVKHAVRKSSINTALPIRQSALPTATRSVLPNLVPQTTVVRTSNVASVIPVVTVPVSSQATSIISTARGNSSSRSQETREQGNVACKPIETPVTAQKIIKNISATSTASVRPNDGMKQNQIPPMKPEIVTSSPNTNNNGSKSSLVAGESINNTSYLSTQIGGSIINTNGSATSTQPTVIVSPDSNQIGQKST